MTELFEPDDRQRELESDAEEQGQRDLIVQAFFFIVFAGGLTLVFHWLAPEHGWRSYAGILAGSYYATWLFRRFLRRG